MSADFTYGRLTIGKREYEVKECELEQALLSFYIDNPRVYSTLRTMDGLTPTQQEIENHMCNMEHVKQLRLSIESNGGLIDPLIVRDGDFTVLEGNSRLAAYRILCKNDPIKWGKVKCKVLPADIDDSAIFTLLGQYHIIGRKDWSPYEQAGYLYRRHQDTKLPIASMAKELGITEGNARTFIQVYEFMIEHNDLTPDKWSYYVELLKNRSLRKAMEETPELQEVLVKQIKTDEIKQAQDIRKLAEIVTAPGKKPKKILKEIVEEKIDIYTAHEEIKETGSLDEVVKKLKKFRDYISDDSFEHSIKDANSDEVKFLLKKIIKRLNDVANGKK